MRGSRPHSAVWDYPRPVALTGLAGKCCTQDEDNGLGFPPQHSMDSPNPVEFVISDQFWLHNRVSNGYTAVMATKNAGLRVRVERALRDEFLDACRDEDKPAAQVIREFMREYVAKRQAEAQDSLFAAEPLEKNR